MINYDDYTQAVLTIDNRPIQPNNPETREYSAIGVIDDNEFGQRSNIVAVTFGG